MTRQRDKPSSARDAYNAFAPVFDEYTARNDHEAWVGGTLLPELAKHGIKVGRVLDIGCGTGKAFPPLLARGWEVHGCDVSEGMLAEAAAKYPDVPLRRADATDLPTSRPAFDLVIALNDVVNYLTGDGDLERFFSGVARSLAPQGLFLFDANTIGLMRAMFEAPESAWMSQAKWRWGGMGDALAPGGTFEAEVSGPGVQPHIHRERHWTPEQVERALLDSGLACLEILGQREEGTKILLDGTVDEVRDAKAIYISEKRQ